MATSNSFDYLCNANDIIVESAEIAGILAAGETLNANDHSTIMRSLNMMTKQWSAHVDSAPGLKAFSRKIGYVFLQKDQGVYSLGPTGDNATLTYVQTTLSTDEATSSTSIGLTSYAGMSASDKIGIVMDNGSIHWTTISGAPAATTTITTGLSSGATAGNIVFTYTTKLPRPLEIETAVLRDSISNDTPMYKMSMETYESLPVKGTDSLPSNYRYDNTLINGTLYLDYQPSDVTYVIRINLLVPAEDYDSQTDDIAFPQEWYLPLAYGLAKVISPKFGQSWTALQESNFTTALSIARESYPETTEVYFQPGID
jgi:hypothetical protein